MKTFKILSWVVVVAATTTSAGDIEEPVAAEPFVAGSWTMQAYGSATFGDNSGELYLAHVGFGYHLWDNISFNAEVVGGGFNAEDEAGQSGGGSAAGGLDLLMRYHFYRGDGWSLYGDAGSGLIHGSIRFPANGTQLNFTPQAGIGSLIDLDDNMYMMVGARWHHVSNARMKGIDQNPGYDGAMIYAGLMFRF